MVNSCNSRSPILLDTPERPGGASGNTVIEIPDSGERNHARRRRLETVEDVIVANSPKRARADVPVIDLTTDNEDESSTPDINTERLFLSIQNSPRYAELRARCLPDETRYRIRRAISLRHRPASHHPSNHMEERQSNTDGLNARTEIGRSNQLSSSARGENAGPPILVDDDDAPSGQSDLFDRASGFPRPSCIRVSPPRIVNSITDSARSSSLPSARSERNSRVSTQSSLNGQDTLESENERHQRGNRRDHLRFIRRNHRQLRENQRQLRERLGYISPFTNYSTSSNENFGRNVQRLEQQATEINHEEDLPSSFNEAVPQRLIRTPPAFPLEGQLRPYDIPDLLLPAVLSWWGPDSRLRHFGDPDDEREDYEALWSLTERLGQVKSKGLTKADMEEIPSFRYSAASKDSSNGSCVVCMMNYSNNEKLRRLPCNHDFHGKCIDRWLKNNRSCPVCRKDVTTK